MNNTFIRIAALLLHILANVFVIAWLTKYDITGGWLPFFGFVLVCLVLLLLLVRHIFSFIRFIKSRTI